MSICCRCCLIPESVEDFIILRIPPPNGEDNWQFTSQIFFSQKAWKVPGAAEQIREEPALMECILVNYGQPQKYLKFLITMKWWAWAVQSGNKAEK